MSNIPEFGVSEFSRSMKMLVEDAFGYVRIRGEVSGFKKAASGHMYFSLKDDDAVLSGVFFKDMAALSEVALEDGLEIVASGRVTTYGARSSYQIIVEKVEVAGLGAILQMLEKRRKKLAAEGLFDEAKKRDLPFFPRKIAVITSRSGAVIQDILHRVEDRCPTEISLYNVAVQGKNASKELVRAVKFFAKMKKDAPDLLIIARGGGSVEDLLPFSDEELVREVFACEIPVISAVGHETDFSLLDYVADLRAPTPSAAAEMATVVKRELESDLERFDKAIKTAKKRFFEDLALKLLILEKNLVRPDKIVAQIEEKLRNLGEKMAFALKENVGRRRERLLQITLSNKDILAKIALKKEKIGHFEGIFREKMQNFIENKGNSLQNLAKLLEAKHYKEILRRGFVMLKNKNGELISSVKQVKMKEEISFEMIDGEVEAYIFGKKLRENAVLEEKSDQLKLL